MFKMFSKTLIVASLLVSTSSFAITVSPDKPIFNVISGSNPTCTNESVSGTYRFQEPYRTGVIQVFPNGTYKVTKLEVLNGVVKRFPKESGTFKLVGFCVASLHVDNTPEEQQYTVLLSSLKYFVLNKELVIVPNSGMWVGGQMERLWEVR